MDKKERCSDGCVYAQDKVRLWQAIIENGNGYCVNSLVEMTGLSLERVESLLEDLHVEEKSIFTEEPANGVLKFALSLRHHLPYQTEPLGYQNQLIVNQYSNLQSHFSSKESRVWKNP